MELPNRELKPVDPAYRATKTYTQLLQEGTPEKGGLSQLASLESTAGPQPSTAVPSETSPPSTSTVAPSAIQQVIQAVRSAFGLPQAETKPDDTAK